MVGRASGHPAEGLRNIITEHMTEGKAFREADPVYSSTGHIRNYARAETFMQLIFGNL